MSILATSPRVVTFGCGPTNDQGPFTLLAGAPSFVAVAGAAVVRLGRPDAGGPHYLTVLFLLSQAIENALKSNLLIRSVTENELRKIGHDLRRVLVETEPQAGRRNTPPITSYSKCRRLLPASKQLQYHRAREMTLALLRPVRELAHEYVGRHRRSSPDDERIDAATAGWWIDPEADYGGPRLAQFREAALPSGDLRDLTDVPGCKDEPAL